MKMNKYIHYFLLILLVLNCELENGVNPPDKQVEDLVNEAWEQFEDGSYQFALEKFEAAISRDNNYAEAYNGAGWSSARLTNLTNAVSHFTQCITLNSSHVAAQAGLAFVYNAQKEYQAAISAANTALSVSSNWLFTHDQTLNYKDLHLILAHCYFALGNFSQSLTHVQKLNPSFTADINTYEGRSALAEEIERLRGIV